MTPQSQPSTSTSEADLQALEAIAAVLVDHAEDLLSTDRPASQ
jgi:hypothetical protein